ncbi:MAG: hypothetical protein ACLQJR_02685 [Stellaceae bacterium]
MRRPSLSSSDAHSRRASFELYVFRRGRWVVDSVHDDKGLAVAEAKRLLERARGLAAVRVVAVEPCDDAFREFVVFYGSNTLAPAVAARPLPDFGLAQPAGAPPAPAPAWPASRVVLLLALILLTATIGVLNRRNAAAHPWIFDSPEAQRPHTVSMPWGQ